MQNLNNRIDKITGLNKSYHIGPAYFLKMEELKDFSLLWKYSLKPLLKEYLRGTPDNNDSFTELEKAYNSPIIIVSDEQNN